MRRVTFRDIKEWKAMRHSGRRNELLPDMQSDPILWGRIRHMEGLIMSFVQHNTVTSELLQRVADLIEAMDGEGERPPPAPPKKTRCSYCRDGGDVVTDSYTEVCTKCGSVQAYCREQHTPAIHSYDAGVDKDHHGTLADQESLDLSETEARVKNNLRRRIRDTGDIFGLCQRTQMEILYNYETLVSANPPSRNRRGLVLAAGAVKSRLDEYAREYEFKDGNDEASPTRRRYDGTDLIYSVFLS